MRYLGVRVRVSPRPSPKRGKFNMQMKRWESPRREGRNDKGKKSSARQRQIKKATQALRRKIKGMEGKDNCLSLFCV
jgi:hypothetical protein